MSVYQGLGRYRFKGKFEVLAVFDERPYRKLPPKSPIYVVLSGGDAGQWCSEDEFTEYLGPLSPPAPPLPTPEQLKDLSACCHGLGWYYSRLGELCQVLADLLGRKTSPGRSVVSHNCCSGMLSWLTTSGYVETDGSHHHGDLVYFVGPDKPEQETYAEFYKARKPRVPREWWLSKFEDKQGDDVFNVHPTLNDAKDAVDWAKRRHDDCGVFQEIVHVREVLG